MSKKILVASLCLASLSLFAQGNLFQKNYRPRIQTQCDKTLQRYWKQAKVIPAREASDSVMVRRAYIDFLGRVPTPAEAKQYVFSNKPEKQAELIEMLLAHPEFNSYWTMRFADAMRIKSEFPINLWPNAVYSYTKIVRDFLSNHQGYDEFIEKLILSKGSNFRQPEANFYRAMATRTPEGIADAFSSFVLGQPLADLPSNVRKDLPRFFECIHYKATHEWKEQVVYIELLKAPLTAHLTSGRQVTLKTGSDPRTALYKDLLIPDNPFFASALVNRVWGWFFGVGTPLPPELETVLEQTFKDSGYDIRSVCSAIATSAFYKLSSIYEDTVRPENLTAYPIRRLDAEVLEDSFRAITKTPGNYSSVIPEPFTFIPKDKRSIEIEDGSMNTSFLLLFGRPARDTGLPSERNSTITAKQRLFLYNSGFLFKRLQTMKFPKQSTPESINTLYWLFYSRFPTEEERQLAVSYVNKEKNRKWLAMSQLSWILLNSKEFLHQH